MTREEAIKKLKKQQNEFNEYYIDYAGVNEAYNMAIKALEQQLCDDCISRQAVIEIAVETGAWETQSKVMDLPSVTPKEKTGKWKRTTDKTEHLVWECDKCGWQQRIATNFCPDCGCHMFEPQGSENKNADSD